MHSLSTAQTIALGAIAGSTIFLGLPLGRLKNPRAGLKAFLNAFSAGILIFLLFDILHNATEPVEQALTGAKDGHASWGSFVAMAAVYVGGLSAGLLSLVYAERFWKRHRPGMHAGTGPGAMSVEELAPAVRAHDATRLGLMIASGIGLHNFSEGLAIGQAAHKGEISLALLLVVGFALHNMTEGFGIIGPLAGAGIRGSWPYLIGAGFLAGGPTFIGTIIGVSFTNQYLFTGFLAMAAGAIIYVVAEMLHTSRKLGRWELAMWGLLAGFLTGLATELVVVAAGV